MTTTVQGGYRCITIAEISNLIALRTEKRITFTALRVYLASHLLVTSRYGAKRARFTAAEIAQRMGKGTSVNFVERALRELAREGLMIFSESKISFTQDLLPAAGPFARAFKTSPKRPVPIPRYILRALVRHKKPAEVLIALVHLARCLFKKSRDIAVEGFVSAEWVSRAFQVSRRAVHNARTWMHAAGILKTIAVPQLVMNRWGARFAVVLPAIKPRRVKRENAGLKRSSLKDLKSTSLNQKYYKPAPSGPAGVLQEPTIRNIIPEDLRRLSRLEVLYHQAVQAGWLPASESNFRNFICAALRASQTQGRVCAVFVGIVKRRLWHHVTQEQEQRALSALSRLNDSRARQCYASIDTSHNPSAGPTIAALLQGFSIPWSKGCRAGRSPIRADAPNSLEPRNQNVSRTPPLIALPSSGAQASTVHLPSDSRFRRSKGSQRV